MGHAAVFYQPTTDSNVFMYDKNLGSTGPWDAITSTAGANRSVEPDSHSAPDQLDCAKTALDRRQLMDTKRKILTIVGLVLFTLVMALHYIDDYGNITWAEQNDRGHWDWTHYPPILPNVQEFVFGLGVLYAGLARSRNNENIFIARDSVICVAVAMLVFGLLIKTFGLAIGLIGFCTANQTQSATQLTTRRFAGRSHNAVIRVYDEAGNGIETHEQAPLFPRPATPSRSARMPA